jgi:hypothetical protein
MTERPGFNAWIDQVDAILTGACGLGVSDLADAPYRDWFEDEMTAREAAALTLSEWNDADDDLMEAFGLADFL